MRARFRILRGQRAESNGFVLDERPKKFARTRRVFRRLVIAGASAIAIAMLGSFVTMGADNPAFSESSKEIAAELSRMESSPAPLARPVIVLSGYRGYSGTGRDLAKRIRELTGADKDEVVTLSYMFDGTIEEPARKLVALVEEKFPSDDPAWTTEVDIVAISMGGLVARLAASEPELRNEPESTKQLNIKTLYTLATPHRGASLADLIAVDDASVAMVPGSEFLAQLDEQLQSASYEIVPYAVLRDRWVGASRAAPWGQDPIWVAGRMFRSHHMISKNRWILADLGLRLRGEEPLAEPSEPPRN